MLLPMAVKALKHFIVIVTLWQLCSVGGQYLQGGLLNSWPVITSSVEAAFQWNDNELQIMQIWIYVAYLLIMLPFAWLMDKKGLFFCELIYHHSPRSL